MLRIRSVKPVNMDAKAYRLDDVDRQCSVCGRYPNVFVTLSALELCVNRLGSQRQALVEYHWRIARNKLAQLPPCDHGATMRAVRRHARRHARYWQ